MSNDEETTEETKEETEKPSLWNRIKTYFRFDSGDATFLHVKSQLERAGLDVAFGSVEGEEGRVYVELASDGSRRRREAGYADGGRDAVIARLMAKAALARHDTLVSHRNRLDDRISRITGAFDRLTEHLDAETVEEFVGDSEEGDAE